MELTCPACGGEPLHLGQFGNTHHFRCRNCGCQFVQKEDSENLCDGFAGDIDGLYNEDQNED